MPYMNTKNTLIIVGVGILLLIFLAHSGKKTGDQKMVNEELGQTATSTEIQKVPAVSVKKTPTALKTLAPVTITIFQYAVPPITRIKKGTTVTWVNKDQGRHQIMSDDPAAPVFDSGLLNQNGSFSYTFTKTGSFAYHCSIHQEMRGTIVVTE
jgi:plastocyanin